MKKYIAIGCCTLLIGCYNEAYRELMLAERELAAQRAIEQTAYYTYAATVVQEESKLRMKALEIKAAESARPYVTMDTDKDGFLRTTVNTPGISTVDNVPLTFNMVPAPVAHKLPEPKVELAEGRKLGETIAKWFTIGYLGGELFGMVRDVASGTANTTTTVTGDTTNTTISNTEANKKTVTVGSNNKNETRSVSGSFNRANTETEQTTTTQSSSIEQTDSHTEENGNYDSNDTSTATWESTWELDADWRATWPSGGEE